MTNYLEQGKTLLEKKEYTKAIEYFQAAIEENPNSERAHLLLGKAYSEANKVELAKKTLFALLSINPNHTEALAEIQKLSFSNAIPAGNTYRANNIAEKEDPIIRTVPPQTEDNETEFWMIEQLSGNKLFFINLSLPHESQSECALVCPEDEAWGGYEEPKGLVLIPNEITMFGINMRVTWIDPCVFSGNKKIREVYIPDSVRKIGRQAFMDTKISKITLPQQLEYIDDEAFAGTKITEVVFPPKLQEIGDFAFCDTEINQVILPKSIQSIGHFCFMGCILKKIHLNERVSSIGFGAFCDSIVPELNIPKSVETIGCTMVSSLTTVKLHCKPPRILDITIDGGDIHLLEIKIIDDKVLLDNFMIAREYLDLYRSDSIWRNIKVKSFNN